MASGVDYPWYEVVSGDELQQGDILMSCPIIKVTELSTSLSGEVLQIPCEEQNVIIMSQSCDLATREGAKCKIEEAILCPMYSQEEMKDDETFKRSDAWNKAKKGQFPAYHVLNRCVVEAHNFDYSIVDLRRVFSQNVNVVREFAASQKSRIRLRPPYREHLSQAFARFFMRVGLPVDIPDFR